MMLHLIAPDFGEAVVSRICDQALVERVRAPSARQRLPLRTQLGTSNPTLLAIVEEMQANLADPLALPDLAAEVGVSLRQIERLFAREMGRSPARYYLELRLERAHSAQPVGAADHRGGGGLRILSGSHFWNAYRKVYGCTPKQTRLTRPTERLSATAAAPSPIYRPSYSVQSFSAARPADLISEVL